MAAVVPINSDVSLAGNAARTIFAASVMTDGTGSSVRNQMIDTLWAYASSNSTSATLPPVDVKNLPGSTSYTVTRYFLFPSMVPYADRSSPDLGSSFAPLALTLR